MKTRTSLTREASSRWKRHIQTCRGHEASPLADFQQINVTWQKKERMKSKSVPKKVPKSVPKTRNQEFSKSTVVTRSSGTSSTYCGIHHVLRRLIPITASAPTRLR